MQQDLRSKSPLEAEERREERRRNLSHLKVGAAICFSHVLHWGRLQEFGTTHTFGSFPKGGTPPSPVSLSIWREGIQFRLDFLVLYVLIQWLLKVIRLGTRHIRPFSTGLRQGGRASPSAGRSGGAELIISDCELLNTSSSCRDRTCW